MLEGWEAPAIRRLSGAYAAEHYAASDPKRPAPARPVSFVATDREVLAQRLLDWALELERQDANP